ncbi:MAG: hypothetical protein ACFFD2_03090 [Promethearchaeota archaeon]
MGILTEWKFSGTMPGASENYLNSTTRYYGLKFPGEVFVAVLEAGDGWC